MAKMRDLKRRITSVNATAHIIHGMKLVSTAKLKTSQERVLAARPFAQKIAQVMNDLASLSPQVHPYFQRRQVQRQGLFVFTSDRGLCGSLNAQIVQFALELLQQAEVPVDVLAVGAEGVGELKKAGIEPVSAFFDYTAHPTFTKARALARLIADAYAENRWQRVDLVYAKFQTVMKQKPRNFQLLPIEPQKEKQRPKPSGQFIYEPDPEVILDHLAKRYVETEIYRALLETQAAEHGSRVTAMEAASDNAHELIEKLTRQYNRARQSAITTELAEIVGGASGLVLKKRVGEGRGVEQR